MTIKGSLLCTCPMLKAFLSENFEVPSKTGPKMAVFGVKGVKCLPFGFATAKRHVLARNRVF